MPLKSVVANLTEVPESLRGEYEQQGDRYVLKLDGELPVVTDLKTKVTEFRDTNVKLLQAIGADSVQQALERVAAFTGISTDRLVKLKTIDPAEYERLKTTVEALQGKGVKDPADVDGRVNAALERFGRDVVNPLKEKLEAAENRERAANTKLDDEKFRRTVAESVGKIKAQPEAIEFLVEKARGKFTVKDGVVTAKPDSFSLSNPGKQLELDEWALSALKEFPFAFHGSTGSGANGGGNGRGLQGKTLVDPTPEELGRHTDAILKGEVVVKHSH